ncbi:MAG: MBL fold metallo-hydrolase [Phycisphaerae bacterium]|nr:MBL fold metallo-hydrolase [Phycisphaerae bacterium]
MKIALGILVMAISGCARPLYEGPVSDHFDGTEFFNQERDRKRTFFDFLRWRFTRKAGAWPKWVDEKPGDRPPGKVAGDDLRVTLVNHATFLIQTQGLNILTDPVWAERIGPRSLALGPKRVRAPGLRFEDLPPIDVVLVSHSHHDHMDMPTLSRLNASHHPLFLAPLGNGRLLERHGLPDVVELDWWQERAVGAGVNITLVPARHTSMRDAWDYNKTLWGGFVISASGGAIYFSGDTGFGMHFEQIRERFGPMRLAMLPIGAYEPRWLMSTVHCSPEEAVRAHKILESRMSVAHHFGTFALADDGFACPAEGLRQAVLKAGLPPDEFIVPRHGEGIVVPPAPGRESDGEEEQVAP